MGFGKRKPMKTAELSRFTSAVDASELDQETREELLAWAAGRRC